MPCRALRRGELCQRTRMSTDRRCQARLGINEAGLRPNDMRVQPGLGAAKESISESVTCRDPCVNRLFDRLCVDIAADIRVDAVAGRQLIEMLVGH